MTTPADVTATVAIDPAEADTPATLVLLRRHRATMVEGEALAVDADVGDATVERWCELTGLVEAGGSTPALRRLTPRPVGDHPEPLVSVLVAAYRPDFLDEVFDSIAVQTYERLEILVGDDCPDERVREYVERRDDLDIRYLGRPPERGSFIGNSRMLLSAARGAHIKFLNDDDWLWPHCIERLTACLVAHPEVTLAGGRRQLIGGDGQVVDTAFVVSDIAGRWGDDFVAAGDRAMTDILARGLNWPGEPTPNQFRRADLIGPDPFAVDGRPAQRHGDLAMWIRLAGRGDVINLAEEVCTIRFHPDQERRHTRYLELVVDEFTELRRDAVRSGVLHPDLHDLQPRPLLPRPWWGPSAKRTVLDAGGQPAWAQIQLALLSEPDDPWLTLAAADHLAIDGRDAEAARLYMRVLQADTQRTVAAERLFSLATRTSADLARIEMAKHIRLVTPYETHYRSVVIDSGSVDPHEPAAPLFAPLSAEFVQSMLDAIAAPQRPMAVGSPA